MITKHSRKLLIGVILVCSLGLLYFASLGIFVRPATDDMFYTTFDGSQPTYNFHFLNGRLSAILLYGLLYELPLFLKIVPLISILILFIGYVIFSNALVKRIFRKDDVGIITLLFASLGSIVTCMILPGLYVSMFWFAAVPVHTWSFGLILIYLGFIMDHQSTLMRKPWVRFLVYFLFPLSIGSLYEAAAASILIVSIITAGLAMYRKIRPLINVALYGTVSSLIGLGILFFSPGAIKRRQWVSKVTDSSGTERINQLPSIIWDNLTDLTPHLLQNKIALVIMLITVAMVTAKYSNINFSLRRLLQACVLVATLTLAYIMLNITIIWIGLGEPQPVRSYFSTSLTLTIFTLLMGIIIGQILLRYSTFIKKFKYFHILLILSVALLFFGALVPYAADSTHELKIYAKEWDRRDLQMKTIVKESHCTVAVEPVPIKGMWVMSNRPSYWVNDAMARYYKLSCKPKANQNYNDRYVPAG